MTKRFGFEMDKKCYKCIVDRAEKKLYTDKKQVVKLLNNLNEEKEELQHQINYLEDRLDDCVCIKKENEQLKKENIGLQSELKIFQQDVIHSNKQSNKLYDENKELKSKVSQYGLRIIALENRVEELQNQLQPMVLTTHISDEDWKEFQRLFKKYAGSD